MSAPNTSPASLNHRHLHYFWVVAKEGGISRAAERLGVAVQTISAQLKELNSLSAPPCSPRKGGAWC